MVKQSGRKKASLAAAYSDSEASAKLAGLRYISREMPGIRRIREADGFGYVNAKEEKISDTEMLIRIKSLGIPPAWEHVWISPWANSHLQATGLDSKGRKQYRYHPEWSKIRGLSKFDRMLMFGEKLPSIREKVREHLQLRGLPREKVLAVIVELLDKTFLRIGNLEYEKENRTYGLTTLRNRHVKIEKHEIQFKFKAKSGKESEISIEDRLLARIVKKCKEIPGYHLFSYIGDDGVPRDISSHDVNEYLKQLSGESFTAKDFRTWGGTLSALEALKGYMEEDRGESSIKKTINSCIRMVAEKLKNTVNVCRKYYIHPKVFEIYMNGKLDAILKNPGGETGDTLYSADELLVLQILKNTA